MLQFLKETANRAYTENAARAYATSESYCLDLFATVGALRHADDRDIIVRFILAYSENPDLAMKILFYARDIRGGLGERRVFGVILGYLAGAGKTSVLKNLKYIAEFGRYDDILSLLGTPCEQEALGYIGDMLREDMKKLQSDEDSVSLLAKWLPSVNTSNDDARADARKIAAHLGMDYATYRKTLASLRRKIDILENRLREEDFSFDYSKQPSLAMLKYRDVFFHKDEERYRAFLTAVASGEVKLNTGSLYPYDVVTPIIKDYAHTMEENNILSLDTTWNALPDYTDGSNALVVVDGSGSMYVRDGSPKPIDVALSLAIYFAERNKGKFSSHFITFSETPRLVEIMGRNIAEKVRFCMTFNEIANTDIEAVYDLILNTAIANKLPQSELPETVYIISDMEFDRCSDNSDITNFDYAKEQYEANGYALPRIVFWNVNSRNMQQPVTKNEQGVMLISGASPTVFSLAIDKDATPYKFMLKTLSSPRYQHITA